MQIITHHKITKADKYFSKRLDFKDIKFPVKVRDIHKIENKNSTFISVFGYEKKYKHPIYVSKTCCEEKHIDLLLIEEEGKRHYILIKDLNTFMHNHTLHCRKKNIFVVIKYTCLDLLSSAYFRGQLRRYWASSHNDLER